MKISERLDKLEMIVSRHLEESGEIRADLRWLKKSVYWVIGGGLIFNLYHLWR